MNSAWHNLIAAEIARRPEPVEARTFHRVFASFSRPVHVACSDGSEFVIKGLRHDISPDEMGRAMASDQVIGRLGTAIGAPVGEVGLVVVSEELIEVNPDMNHLKPGTAHGCRWIPGTTDRMWGQYMQEVANRERFAKLAILYGWMHANDHQVIYEEDTPHYAHSVDHGHFLPDAYQWTPVKLEADTTPVPDPHIMEGARLTPKDVANAAEQLSTVTDEVIARAVASPPDEWGITMDERKALAHYIAKRRDVLFSSLTSRS